MESDFQTHVAFYLTGKRTGNFIEPIDKLNLRPALLASFRDLTSLRYDFPVVLMESSHEDSYALPLSGIVDGILAETASGSDGERIRKHMLRLEKEIRKEISGKSGGRLREVWDRLAAPMASSDKLIADSLNRCRAALKMDGRMIDCDASMPEEFIKHAWKAAQISKEEQFVDKILRLSQGLSDILKADFLNSDAGRSAGNLKSSMGSVHESDFDFSVMSTILTQSRKGIALPEKRRKRIENLLKTLQNQKFVAMKKGDKAYPFVFNSCSEAMKAYQERMPELIELARAIAIADFECRGHYDDEKHSSIFESFGETGLDAQDLALYPDYLVCIKAVNLQGSENDNLNEILSMDLPIKIFVQTDDLLAKSTIAAGYFSVRCKQLVNMAIGQTNVYVLQSASSNLVQMKKSIFRGMVCPGASLFSIFSGASSTRTLPVYLTAAAAMESRLFPAFVYDPSRGKNWASKFSLENNPQQDRDWPVQEFSYEDADQQKAVEIIAFTPLDFAACDKRFAGHFARVPRDHWNGTLVSVKESMNRVTGGLPEKVPSLLMVDENNMLQKVLVDQQLMRAANRSLEMWQSLQEMGGVNNSHAQQLLARERESWEAQLAAASSGSPAEAAAAQTPAAQKAVPSPGPLVAEEEPVRSADEAYIETPRCSTCNECTQINSKMFAYDENKQAFIKDIKAGTFAQLVEAAESCQVAIIHPGKPINPNEPGLEDLIKRAEAFR